MLLNALFVAGGWLHLATWGLNPSVVQPRCLFTTKPASKRCSWDAQRIVEQGLGLETGWMSDRHNWMNINSIFAMLRTLLGGEAKETVIPIIRAFTSALPHTSGRMPAIGHKVLAIRQQLQNSGADLRAHLSGMGREPAWNYLLNPEEVFINDPIGWRSYREFGSHFLIEFADLVEGNKSDKSTRPSIVTSKDSSIVTMADDPTDLSVNSAKLFQAFIGSAMMSEIVSLLFAQPVLNQDTATLLLSSPMKNIGEGFCDAVDASFARDGDLANTYTCIALSLVSHSIACSEAKPSCTEKQAQDIPPDNSCDLFLDQETPRRLLRDQSDSSANHSGASTQNANTRLVVDLDLRPAAKGSLSSQHEGIIAYYLFRACRVLYEWVDRTVCHDGDVPAELVPGWETVVDVQLNEPAADLLENSPIANLPGLPLVHLSRRTVLPNENSCRYLITIRGTQSSFEWRQNLRIAQSPIHQYPKGKAHSGQLEITTSYVPLLVEKLLEEFKSQNCQLDNTVVTLTGHSLGGGLAELTAVQLAATFSSWGTAPRMQLITFAPARSLDRAATDFLAKRVDVRTWIAELDPIPYWPCSNRLGLGRCNRLSGWETFGEGFDNYAEHLNPVMIPVAALAKTNPLFSAGHFGSVSLQFSPSFGIQTTQVTLPAPLQMSPYHVCAYACFLSSQYCNADEADYWMCQSCEFS